MSSNLIQLLSQGFYGNSDPYWDKVTALLLMNGDVGSQVFPDLKGHTFSTTGSTGAKIVADPSAPGGVSAGFDGSSNSWITGDAGLADYQFHQDDFTMEAFITQTARAGVAPIISMGLSRGNGGLILYVNANGYLDGSSGQYNYLLATDLVVPLNERVHVAMTRQVGIMSCWLNGQLAGRVTNMESFDMIDGLLQIGGAGPDTYRFTGTMDSVRVTRGIARYTQPFTVPNAPLPTQ